jgi:hypothetical protein
MQELKLDHYNRGGRLRQGQPENLDVVIPVLERPEPKINGEVSDNLTDERLNGEAIILMQP